MIRLSNKVHPIGRTNGNVLVGLVTTDQCTPKPLRNKRILLLSNTTIAENISDYLAVLIRSGSRIGNKSLKGSQNIFLINTDFDYLADGDIVRIYTNTNDMRVIYRRNSNHNSFLLTERCNSYCLMCSQPPKPTDDSHIVNELLAAIPLIDRTTHSLGFTGGEPTLLGERFIELLKCAKHNLPNTSLHVLSNGRNFRELSLTAAVSNVGHPQLMFGIPLYSDLSHHHDFIVQADGAYDETIRGILNLKRYGISVELRVVVHKLNYQRLVSLAHFITRNLLFLDHVAFMGLELVGFAKTNLDALWVDPFDYKDQLREAIDILANFRMNISVYNHPLCLIDKKIWKFARKSISDWKNEYLEECKQCHQVQSCGGLFSSSAIRLSPNLKAILDDDRSLPVISLPIKNAA